MTISNEDILKYFMTDDYPHDAGTLAAKEKIDQLQHQNDELVARIARLEQQLKTAKADGVREFIPTIKAMEEPDYLKGRFQAELFWRGAFAAQKLAEEYANSLEGK